MSKTKIYAGSIENLTDARYFAAWYVDWMGFNLKKQHSGEKQLQEISAIKEWVDVKGFVAEFSGLEDPKRILELSESLNINAVKLGPSCPITCLKAMNNMVVFKELIFDETIPLSVISKHIENERQYVDHFIIKIQNNEQIRELANIFEDKSFYIEPVDLKTFILEGKLNVPVCEGIVVHGSIEEQKELKSFEELDEVYEVLF